MSDDETSLRQWAIDDLTAAFKASGVRRPRKTATTAVNAFADWLVGFDDLRDALNEGRPRDPAAWTGVSSEGVTYPTTEGFSTTLTQPLIGSLTTALFSTAQHERYLVTAETLGVSRSRAVEILVQAGSAEAAIPLLAAEGFSTTLTQPPVGMTAVYPIAAMHNAVHAAAVAEKYRVAVQAVGGDVDSYERLTDGGMSPEAAYNAVLGVHFAPPPPRVPGSAVFGPDCLCTLDPQTGRLIGEGCPLRFHLYPPAPHPPPDR